MKHRLTKVALALLVIGGISAWAFGWWWLPHYAPSGTKLPSVPFRTMAQHDDLMRGRQWPYIVELEGKRGALFYYGSRHTDDPGDPQVADIEQRWANFGPTVAVTENRLGPFVGTRAMGVRAFGEFALAASLADEVGIDAWSLEPPWQVEVDEMKANFPTAEVTLFYTLRVFLSERGDLSGTAVDDLAAHLLQKRGGREGLEGSLPDLESLDRLWEERFADLGPWRQLPPQAIHPSTTPTRLQQLANLANEVRDRHAARTILELVQSGERVFAIAGGSHVVKQEPVLRAGLQAN